MSLESYRGKRHFKRTPEPPPGKKQSGGPLIFVVQKHSARSLHYDLRLEFDGVLKSWAVPKGPSIDPADKRLAVMVEDHPLDYAGFEGNIPEGEYGAGEVIVWDSGTYSPDEGGTLLFNDRAAAEEEMRRGLEKGKLSFVLRGQKLKGSWTLVKIQKKQKDWLLMKHRDEFAGTGTDILEKAQSVVTARTVEDVKARRPIDKQDTAHADVTTVPGARPAPFPTTVSPMLASLAEKPFSHPDWLFEPKLDGYRIISFLRGGKVKLLSRNGNNVSEQYSSLMPDLERQPASEIVLDGEIIAMDEKGKQCFQCLQNYLRSLNKAQKGQTGGVPLIYYVFDILYLDGFDLRGVPLRHRKELLKGVLNTSGRVKLVDYFEGDGETVYKASVENGLEGVMAKLAESVYESGKRSRDWLKIKSMRTDEFVIGGYSAAEKGRKDTFSSLLLGQFDAKGKLIFSGHVGTGFDEQSLAELKKRLDKLKTTRNPFAGEPPLNAPTTWVRPELVAEIKYSERTQDGRLRIPVFLRLREDKEPAEALKIKPITASDPPPKPDNGEVERVLEQLGTKGDAVTLELAGVKIPVGHIDKELWPATSGHQAFTKRHFLTYLAKVSPYLLPHLKDRPLTLTRFPDGIYGEHFFQKHWGHPLPDFVERVSIREESAVREYMICSNLATLMWLGQIGNIEFHTWFSRIVSQPDMPKAKKDTDYLLDFPDFIIFDLDPYIYSGKEKSGEEPELNRRGFEKTCEVALWLKEVLDELELKAFIKTSGKTGLHIYVPIVRKLDYKAVRAAAEMVGQFLLQRHPEDITMEWAVEKRTGKIFVDYGQNVRGKTLASIYSPRPVPQGTVSAPLRWEEMGKVYPEEYSLITYTDRLKATGDLWAGILSEKRDLDKLLEVKKNRPSKR
jgi:bifunctional non-homologous end joining protein LigD